jgi:hypothetical protein
MLAIHQVDRQIAAIAINRGMVLVAQHQANATAAIHMVRDGDQSIFRWTV